jgi:hypothetical protein
MLKRGDGMKLDEVKELLIKDNISFEMREYLNEKEYWLHTMMFPYIENAKDFKVIALTIASNNGKKNIELQFNEVNDDFVFVDLMFGDYCFELFDHAEETLATELVKIINKIKSGRLAVIVKNNIKKKRWLGDATFDLDDDDELLGKQGFEEVKQMIKKSRGFISKLFKPQIQYEIYDWNSYDCIMK